MNRMNKILLFVLCLLVCATPFTNVFAEDKDDVNIQIDIKETEDGQYEVIVEDDQYYSEYEPTIYVITGDETNYVYIKNSKTKIDSKNEDGKVYFKVTSGGTYCVVDTKPDFFTDEPTVTPSVIKNKSKVFVSPKTGIE